MSPDAIEILESLRKEVTEIQYVAPSSPVESRLANAIACLISVFLTESAAKPISDECGSN